MFERFEPSLALNDRIKEFWVYENPDLTPQPQKVIPDGFSEVIIHYGDLYRINLNGSWEQQSQLLFSNQISRYFHLENTGASAMIGMKMFPEAGYELFGKDMSGFTDRVVPLQELAGPIDALSDLASTGHSTNERISVLEKWVEIMLSKNDRNVVNVRHACREIFDSNGLIDGSSISDMLGISLRQLERLFKKSTGVTIKFLSRIVRFNYIFQLMKNKEMSWIQLALESGYFDQSHFIKDFKEFTGEEPSSYGFDEKTLANFFLKK